MGKLILCSGVRTIKPYILEGTNFKAYSIEELCYYIGEHIYLVEEAMFSEGLIEWMDKEVKISKQAEKLRSLKVNKGDIKAMLAVLLCSCDYYTEEEIKKLILKVDELSKMSPYRKKCMKADCYLQDKKYIEAENEYEEVLTSDGIKGMTPEEYGDILHNLGVAMIYSKGTAAAAEVFMEAYTRNHKIDSLYHYFFAYGLSEGTETLDLKFHELGVDEQVKMKVKVKLMQASIYAESSKGMAELRNLKERKQQLPKEEYHEKVDHMIQGWIHELRKL